MAETNPTPLRDIMQYEPQIWAAADLLIAAGIKQSKFPDFMMPFFALVMLESRMRNVIAKLEEEGLSRETNLDEFIEAFRDEKCGYNEFIVKEGKTLSTICSNDKTFEQDFNTYRKGFDPELKMLLGIDRGTEEQKFLNMDGIVAELRAKKILLATVTKWAEIDLSGYDNSAITTLEEHIKRRWADISAETAGEQYTPDDIISLISEIVVSKISVSKSQFVHVYDPTCGGGNLLFGVADRLKANGYKYVATYGCDLSDSLYALSCIESKFRTHSKIQHGNTLTKVPFLGTEFNVVIANPPYGVSWKGYESDIKNDQTGQFQYYPSVSDGQLLFMQHILFQLADTGIAVEVHNGSTLFSGDAGGGESNIRKYIFDKDWVEAIIQMPSDEFFNTGIYTYLWIMNKNKAPERRDKVMLINGSNGWKLLKKSKGNKRREMLPEHRTAIVEALAKFENCEIGKVYDKWHFYYNKQALTLTDVDEADQSVLDTVCKGDKPFKVEPALAILNNTAYSSLTELEPVDAATIFDALRFYDPMQDELLIKDTAGSTYAFNADLGTFLKEPKTGKPVSLGCGKWLFKLTSNKKTGKQSIQCAIVPAYINDYEIIDYSPNEDENEAIIDAFLQKYVYRPYAKKDNIVGVELNFNKEFYVPEEIDSVDKILSDLSNLEKSLSDIKLDF